MSGQSLPRRSWPAIAAGGATLLVIVTHQLAIAAYPTYFSGAGDTPSRDAWDLGWPWRFATMSMSGELSRLSALALSADVVVAIALAVGVALAVGDWTRGHIVRPTANVRLAAIVALTALGWLLLGASLRVPWGVFVGWAALALVFLAIPCAAYALSRFSLRGLFIAVTVLCTLLALAAWRIGRPRAERLARAAEFRVDQGTYEYGIAESIETLSGGRAIAWDYNVVERTQLIPAELGTIFGVEYTVVRDSAATTAAPSDISVVEVWHYPGELVDPRTGIRQRHDTRQHGIRVTEPQVSVVRLQSEPYLMPGEWKFELWLDTGGPPGERRMLLEQTFVVGDKPVAVPGKGS